MSDIRRNDFCVTRDRRQRLVDSGMDFGDAAHLVEEIGEQSSRWQDLEYRSLKNILGDPDRDGRAQEHVTGERGLQPRRQDSGDHRVRAASGRIRRTNEYSH